MPLEVIYVARHGFRSNWLVDHSTGTYTATLRSPTGGAADPALTAHGVGQAKELGERLLKAEPPIERVYSSLYYRCLQTVEPFVRKAIVTDKCLSIRGETGLGEWYGAANFEHPVPASHETLRPLFPGLLDEEYKPLVTPTRMGEGVNELHDRVARTMNELIAQCDREGVRAVLLCSHAATIIALGRVLTGNMPESIDTEDFRAFTCGLSVYRRRTASAGSVSGSGVCDGDKIATSAAHDADRHKDLGWRGGRGVGGGWECELNSDCSHLSLGEERGWRFSGDESFLDTASGQSMLDAGELGVVVEGRAKARGSTDAAGSRGKL
ncbi:putative transcription factor tau 55 kDa subunit [Triangularia verruculosa]|uniref:Transcription factor tau 55 kDa subunit n=1 Tax=Triangularia verruculosa TaxID=2587418 RepID=A0AAN7AVJ2_9PEZI|nr:putative transcription factor tau 55 kDa subunit [Triangularia verruculosa]